ncbi:ATP-binding protein [Cesiribacter sp. SM1]|uniref:ATP-binding protein n=1 Tax=Cesiribacter sp. SM1 TaxID=2861196 RepID=UPI001CD2B5C8|nr:ATP-binding protein [Cesiribacter sp. SM1]
MPTEAVGLTGEDYSDAEYVYYSNIFDLRSEEINMQGLHNLSTLALLKTDRSDVEENPLENAAGSYDSFRANEIRRNIQFLLSNHSHLLHYFPLPEHLFIKILNHDEIYFKTSKSTDVTHFIDHFTTKLKSTKSSKNQNFLNKLYLSILLNFLRTDRQFSSLSFITQLSFNQSDTIKKFVLDFFNNLPNIKYNTETTIENHVKKSRAAIEFLNFVEKSIKKKSFVVEQGTSSTTIKYSINEGAYDEITLFLKLYINLKGLTDFLDFSWRNLSSGEQSLFSFISRFYHFKHHQIQHEDHKKNIVILIDEGDIYFHPAWQKEFFLIVIDYLSELLRDHTLQLIFTANTPFLTSDLPKSNVIFIEKLDKRTVYVLSKENNRKNTFGGNIHTLFSDSFYMEGALIGAFAKRRINEIIEYLNGETKEKREDYKKTIDIIGEPLLRRKLQQMWAQKFGVEEEIAELQKRIDELKRKM